MNGVVGAPANALYHREVAYLAFHILQCLEV